MEFQILTSKKGCTLMGMNARMLERSFFVEWSHLGFLNSTNAPTEEAKQALLPGHLECLSTTVLEKTVIYFS